MQIAVIRAKGSSIGGAELYLHRLMEAMVGAGHEVHLLAASWEGLPSSVRLHRLALAGSRAARPLALASAAAAVVARERFECVLSLERTACQHVYRAGDGVHRVWLEERRRHAPWWKRPFVGMGAFHRNILQLERRTFDPAITRRVIVNSNEVRSEILRCFSFPDPRIRLVRNGINVDRFRRGDRASTRARLGIAPDEKVLLFVGSGWERKGLGAVVEAYSRLRPEFPRLRLVVVGKSRSRPSAPGLVLAGPMADIENAYAAADLFVFPPIYEPSANVVLEALAAGLPVITTAINGASEVLSPGVNGTVLPDPRDARALADAIRHWIGRPGRIEVDTGPLRIERNLRETLSVLEEAVSDAPARPLSP